MHILITMYIGLLKKIYINIYLENTYYILNGQNIRKTPHSSVQHVYSRNKLDFLIKLKASPCSEAQVNAEIRFFMRQKIYLIDFKRGTILNARMPVPVSLKPLIFFGFSHTT